TPPNMSQDERDAALNLVRDEELLPRFLDDIESMGCVGEETNKHTLLLACISRLLPQPINVTVKGESSAGKNYQVDWVTQFLPPEKLHPITSASAKSLFYIETDYRNSVVVIAEAPGGEESDYSIRSMQSENKLVALVTEKQDGKFVTVEHTVEGPIAFIQTTTKPHLHTENETRVFD